MRCLVYLLAWLSISNAETDEFSELTAELIRNATPSEDRQKIIPQVISHLENVLDALWPGCKIELHGSYVYGLATRYSDIDASVMLPHHDGNYQTLVEQAHALLRQKPEFTDFRPITWVLVPVVSFKHKPTNFNIDISINAYREFKITSLMKYLVGLDERIYKLAFIVKYWAKLNNIMGSRVLANYGMTVLVIFYLQQKKILPSIAALQKDAEPFMYFDWNYGFNELDYKIENDQPLNVLVGEFFEYYSTFDFEKYIVAPFVGYPIERWMFEDLETVPDEFELYKYNVMNNISQPLSLTKPILLQDLSLHDQSVMSFHAMQPNCSFAKLLNFAAAKYRENANTFLKEILSEDVLLFMLFDKHWYS